MGERSRVRQGFMKSLHDLQLDYIDLFLIHSPVGFKVRVFTDQGQPTKFNQLWTGHIYCHFKSAISSSIIHGVNNFHLVEVLFMFR